MLELTITEGLSPDNPTEKKKSFNDRGGVIGRDVKADWALYDPSRVVSSQHAKVIFSQGAYYLSDLSANGIMTEQGVKLRKGEYRLLKMGEVYCIGSYRFEVTALNTEDAAAPFKEAGLGHILKDAKQEQDESISPLDYAQKQNNPLTSVDPFPDLPIKQKPNTLKAFDFMPEPVDFTQAAPAKTSVAPVVAVIPEKPAPVEFPVAPNPCSVTMNPISTEFMGQFFERFGLNAAYFSGMSEAELQQRILGLFESMLSSMMQFYAFSKAWQQELGLSAPALGKYNPFEVAISSRQALEIILRGDSEFMQAQEISGKLSQDLNQATEGLWKDTQTVVAAMLDEINPKKLESETTGKWALKEKAYWQKWNERFSELTANQSQAWISEFKSNMTHIRKKTK